MFKALVAVVIISGIGLIASIVLYLNLRAQQNQPQPVPNPGGSHVQGERPNREFTDGAEINQGGADPNPTTDTPDESPIIPAATAFQFDRESPLAPTPTLVDYKLLVPEFNLVDQDGNPVDQTIFEDHPTVLSFIFTHCVLICPTMTAQMHRVYTAAAGSDINFVSISVDPEHDTPARLRQYAAGFGIDHARWSFLTGESDVIHEIATQSLQFNLSEDPSQANRIALADGSTMSNILHPSRLILVAPDRTVIGLYNPNLEEDIEELIARLKAIEDAR